MRPHLLRRRTTTLRPVVESVSLFSYLLVAIGLASMTAAGCESGTSPSSSDTGGAGGADAATADIRPDAPDATSGGAVCGAPRHPDGSDDWRILCDGERVGNFLSVWGAGPDDVYMVGGRTGGRSGDGDTQVVHWNGDRLEQLDVPGDQRAWWVFGTDRNHVYVVGENGLGLRRIDGGEFERFETGIDQTIFGAWGPTPDRIYLVSGDVRDEDAQGQLRVLTPDGVERVRAPALDAFDGRALFKVWGSGPDDVFVSGSRGAIFHFDGDRWRRMETPETDAPILTVSGRDSDDVYAVGGRTGAVAWHYDGSSWQDASPESDYPRLMGVHTAPEAPVLVSGARGFLARLGSNGFERFTGMTRHPLHAVWRDSEGAAWAVGGNIFSTSGAARGVVLRRPPPEDCPEDAIREPGFHHLDFQGSRGARRPDGTYPMFDVPRGEIHPDLVHGEHFTTGKGTFTEFSIPLCADITDEVGFRITHNEDPGVEVLYELFVRRGDREFLVAKGRDTMPGNQGYIPHNRSSLPDRVERAIAETDTHPDREKYGWKDFEDAPDFEQPPRDILARPGDELVFRATNLSEKTYGLMVWYPQDGLHYQTFLEVRVPETPGGEVGEPDEPPPEPGPCDSSEETAIELGRSGDGFEAFPPAEVVLEEGLQGSLMFRLALRGEEFAPGDPDDPLDSENPRILLRLALDAYPDEGGRIIVDSSSRRGFETDGSYRVLPTYQPVVKPGTAEKEALLGETIYAELELVDATDGTTLCAETTFTAVAP